MSAFTRLGSGLWDWEPFYELPSGAQILWLALYSSAEAKRIVPGLWHGSITAMAEASRKPVDETRTNLDSLLEHEMVEFDIKLRVLRLTKLPDAGESPANPNVIRGWFRKFTTLPACSVRDAHVPLLRWLMDTWSRENGKPVTAGHEEAWKETFGRIAVPAPRKRGVRRLVDSDTSTPEQPSLFQVAVSQTVSRIGSLALPEHSDSGSVDNSDSLHKLNYSGHSETVVETVSKPSGSGSGLGSGSGSPESEGGSGGGKVIALVLPPRPLTADGLVQVIAEVCGGSWSLAPGTPERAMVEDQVLRLPDLDLALLGSWMRSHGTGDQLRLGRELLSHPGTLIWAHGAAARWSDERAARAARAEEMSAELRRQMDVVAGLTTTKGTA